MDFHPLLVHFPIALFTIYSVMEIVSWKKIKENVSWFYVKFSFLILGVISAFITFQTGNMAKESLNDISLRHLVDVHSSWASATIILFVVILGIYVLELLSNENLMKKKIIPKFVRTPFKNISGFLFRPIIIKLIAFVGFIMITVTGSLGGAIVYGPDADPFVRAIYNFLIGG